MKKTLFILMSIFSISNQSVFAESARELQEGLTLPEARTMQRVTQTIELGSSIMPTCPHLEWKNDGIFYTPAPRMVYRMAPVYTVAEFSYLEYPGPDLTGMGELVYKCARHYGKFIAILDNLSEVEPIFRDLVLSCIGSAHNAEVLVSLRKDSKCGELK